MYLFDNPSYLYLALIIPIVIIINWLYMAWRNKIQRSFSNYKLLDQISPNRSNFKLNLIQDVLASKELSLGMNVENWPPVG